MLSRYAAGIRHTTIARGSAQAHSMPEIAARTTMHPKNNSTEPCNCHVALTRMCAHAHMHTHKHPHKHPHKDANTHFAATEADQQVVALLDHLEVVDGLAHQLGELLRRLLALDRTDHRQARDAARRARHSCGRHMTDCTQMRMDTPRQNSVRYTIHNFKADPIQGAIHKILGKKQRSFLSRSREGISKVGTVTVVSRVTFTTETANFSRYAVQIRAGAGILELRCGASLSSAGH